MTIQTPTPAAVQPVARAEVQRGGRERSIGAILVDSGKLSAAGAEQILRLQKEKGMRFGEAAIKLGLLTEADIQFALSRQYDYPYLVHGQSKVSHELVAAYSPFSPQVEALRALRSQLMLRWFDAAEQRKALAVVSPGKGEGRSFVAANLAIVFSQLGEHTLLIDGDMRNPRQHVLFGLDNRAGLSTILAGRGDRSAIQRVPDFKDLSLLPAGAVPPNPQELLLRPQFGQLLAELCNEFDVVILDTSAGDISADAQTLATQAGGALVVARKHHSSLPAMQALSNGIVDGHGVVVGVVLNEF